MKKHLVMIVGNFYPNPSPTGKCAEAYIDLLRDQFDISVICFADTSCEPYNHNGKQVYPTSDWYSLLQHRLAEKNTSKLLQNVAKIPVHMVQFFVHPNNLYGFVEKARKQLEAIHAKKPIDVVFSVGAPMAAHVAARNFRRSHPDIRWVTYTVDSYAAQNKSSRRYATARAFEATVLSACDCALLSEEIYESDPALYQDFADKCKVLPYLMPATPKPVSKTMYFDDRKINLVYAGRFYKNIRNPEYLLRLAVEMDEDCVLHLYCQSDCDAVINDYVRRSNGKILRHTQVSSEEIKRVYAAADILASVGNSTPEFRPSKTFEYIASGKPIVNIYYEGLYDEVLAQSPLTLQLQRSAPIEESARALHSFIAATRGKNFLRKEIDKTYYKHSGENILSILETAMAVE